MDYRTRKYIGSEMLARRITGTMRNEALDSYTSSGIDVSGNVFDPDLPYWFRICSVTMNSGREETGDSLRRALSCLLDSARERGSAFVYMIMNRGGETVILLGTDEAGAVGSAGSYIAECRINAADRPLVSCGYNGMMTGPMTSAGISDRLIAEGLEDYYMECITVPLSDSELNSIIRSDRSSIEYLSSCSHYRRSYGNATRRDEDVPVPDVSYAVELMKDELKRIERDQAKGFVKTLVRYGASSGQTYRKLTGIVASCFGNGIEPLRQFDITGMTDPYLDLVSIPAVTDPYGEVRLAVSMQDTESAAAFCMPPVLSCRGYAVKNYSVDEDSPEVFPLQEDMNGECITTGSSAGGSGTSKIPLRSLHSHAFVTGATETGKTTTVKRMLTELHERGVNFTVLEAAKKEYCSLISQIPALRVYTAGADGIRLRINPLQPEDGTLIENHVDAVVRALLASSGGEHPIPEAWRGLLKQTYAGAGWEFGMMAYKDDKRPFPTFKDVFENIDDYIEGHAGYGYEVRQNLQAALKIRTETMYTGALGSLFAGGCGLQSEDLLMAPGVIELSDLSGEAVTFLMNILLFKFQSYLCRQPASDELKRVIVIEEAHNIFKKTVSEDSGRALNNDHLDKMLSEIRSSGTGLIISDQRPSVLSDAVMANTSVKIIHAMTDRNDRDTVGSSADLSELQIKRLSEFSRGECVISVKGLHGVQHSVTEPLPDDHSGNPACLVCPNRFRCISSSVGSLADELDDGVVSYHISRIRSAPYDACRVQQCIDDMLGDLNVFASGWTGLCLLGELIRRNGSISEHESRVIVNTYSDHLRGGSAI